MQWWEILSHILGRARSPLMVKNKIVKSGPFAWQAEPHPLPSTLTLEGASLAPEWI